MARIEGFRAALGALGKTRETDIVVHGMPYLSRHEIPELLGVPPSSLLRGGSAKSMERALSDGTPIWPLDLVRERVAASGKLAPMLDRLPDFTSNRFVPLPDARAAFATRSDEQFLKLLEREKARPVFVIPTSGGPARRMVPAHVLAASTPAADAVAGARAAGAGRGRPRVPAPAPAPAPPQAAAPAPKPVRKRTPTPGPVAPPREPAAEHAAHTTGPRRRPSRTTIAVAGAGAGVAALIALSPGNRPNGTTPAARTDGGEGPPAPPAAKPGTPDAPVVPAPTAEEVAARRRVEMGARIAAVAAAEEAKGVVATWGADGRATGEVAKYFATSEHARPTNDYDWPAYFAAWVREEAGDPITPGTDWLKITDLISHANATSTWRGRDHEASPGDVVFFTTPKTGDETGNNVGIVRAVKGDQLLVVRGWVKDGNLEKVAEVPLDRNSPSIGGYAVVSP